MKNLTSNGIQKEQRENPGKFRRFLAGSLAAAALFSSPLLERTASAQTPAPEERPQQTAQVQMRDVHFDTRDCTDAALTNGESQIHSCAVISGRPVPTISFDGPAVVTARFYPVIAPTDAQTQGGSLSLTARYSVDGGAAVDSPFSSSVSQVSNPTISNMGLAIGSPDNLRVTVSGDGSHTFAVTFPNGFIEVVSVQAPQQPAPLVQRPAPRPQPVQQPVQQPVHPQPAAPERPLQSVRSRVSLNYDGIWFNSLGNSGNGGYINGLDGLYRHPLGEHLALLVGPRLSLARTGISYSGSSTGLMIGNVDAMAGLALNLGDSTLYLAGFGGLQTYSYDVTSADGRSMSDTQLGGSFGGRLGFDYNDIVGLSAELSNNPFMPGIARLRIAIPYSWVRDARPSLEADLMWLHMLKPGTDGGLGGGSLSEENLLLRSYALVPIWRLGPVVPSALVGLQYDRSLNGAGPADQLDALLGGSLALDISNSFRIEAGAGATVPTGTPFILLNANIR